MRDTMHSHKSSSDHDDDDVARRSATYSPILPRRGAHMYMLLLPVLALLVVLGVYAIVQHDNTAALPFDTLHTALQHACADVVAVSHDTNNNNNSTATMTTTAAVDDDNSKAASLAHAPPPASYGVAVWTDDVRWLRTIHSTLDELNARLTTRRDGDGDTPVRLLHRVVHVRKATCPSDDSDDDSDDDDDGRHRRVLCQRTQRDSDGSAASTTTALSTQQAWLLRRRAEEQQLGLPMLRFAFQPRLGESMQLLAVSVLTLPPRHGTTAQDVQCMTYDADRFVCVVYASHNTHDANRADATTTQTTTTTRQLRAALSSVVATALAVPSFRRDDVLAWQRARDVQSCRYAAHGLRTLQAALTAHASATVTMTRDVYDLCDALAAQLQRRARVAAAQLVDQLRNHPTFTPQLYIPRDHALLSLLTLLQPLLVVCLLGVRAKVKGKGRRARTPPSAPHVKAD